MVINNPRMLVQAGSALASVALILLADILYVQTGFGPVSIFLFLAAPLLFIFLTASGKICFGKIGIVVYAFAFILSLYTAIGIVAYNRPTLAIQFLSISISIFLFFNIGYFAPKNLLAKLILAINILTALFAASQFSLFTIQYSGPFSIFETISEIIIQSQIDYGVEILYGRSSGIFINPNILGLFAGLTFWLTVYLKEEYSKITYYFCLLLSLICLILSISRGSIIGFLTSSFLFGILSIKEEGKSSISKFSSVVMFFIAIYSLFQALSDNITESQTQRFAELFYVFGGDFDKSDNAIGRIDAWSGIINLMQDMPMGTLVPPQILINHSPDNQFIYYLAQGGPILFAAVIFFYASLVFLAGHRRNKKTKIYLAIIIFSATNSISMPAMNSSVFMLFWVFMGLHSRPIY
jgi:hypothetical protein